VNSTVQNITSGMFELQQILFIISILQGKFQISYDASGGGILLKSSEFRHNMGKFRHNMGEGLWPNRHITCIVAEKA